MNADDQRLLCTLSLQELAKYRRELLQTIVDEQLAHRENLAAMQMRALSDEEIRQWRYNQADAMRNVNQMDDEWPLQSPTLIDRLVARFVAWWNR